MVASFDAFGTVLISRQEGGVGEAQSCEPLRPSGDRGEYVKSGEVFRFPKRKGLALAATVLISIGCGAARAQPVEPAARVEADISGLVRVDPPAPEEADPREVDPRPSGGRGRAGEVVPDLEVGTLEGTPISLATLEGKVVILNFWATWCLPCIAEMPELAELQTEYREKGVELVAVSEDREGALEKICTFVADREFPFSVWLDPEMDFYYALELKGLPTTFVLDREGRILLRRDAPIQADDPELRDALRRALRSGGGPGAEIPRSDR